MFIEKIRHAIILKAAFLVFSFTLVATIIRPMLIEQSAVFTYLGLVNSFAMGCVFLYLKQAKPKPWHAGLFSFFGLLVLLPIVLISGGVNSQFSYLFPIIPIFIALISNAKSTWITAIIIIVLIIAMYFSADLMPDFTYEDVPQSKSAARTLWLCLSVLLSTTFGIEFNRINSTLGNKLKEQAEIDPLTGIHNRRSVMNFLKATMEDVKLKNGSLSVMMIDLDHFKAINDSYGHLVGDSCLKAAAQSIQMSIRNDGDLAGRYGGKEFMVVIRDIDSQKALIIADQIRGAIEQTSVSLHDGTSINLTATIGICTLNAEDSPSIDHVVDLADKALYKGKKAGRNRVEIA
ncbi:MAG: diguanylate cyclase (GGDEF)-like protein [Paraglaciecola sp.]